MNRALASFSKLARLAAVALALALLTLAMAYSMVGRQAPWNNALPILYLALSGSAALLAVLSLVFRPANAPVWPELFVLVGTFTIFMLVAGLATSFRAP